MYGICSNSISIVLIKFHKRISISVIINTLVVMSGVIRGHVLKIFAAYLR